MILCECPNKAVKKLPISMWTGSLRDNSDKSSTPFEIVADNRTVWWPTGLPEKLSSETCGWFTAIYTHCPNISFNISLHFKVKLATTPWQLKNRKKDVPSRTFWTIYLMSFMKPISTNLSASSRTRVWVREKERQVVVLKWSDKRPANMSSKGLLIVRGIKSS